MFIKDISGEYIQIFAVSAPQYLTVNASSGDAVLSAALTANIIRMQPDVDTFFLFTVSGAVTEATGHMMRADNCYEVPVTAGCTKVSVLGASASAGKCAISGLT